ncbi:MAG: tryptophan synthase subunit alpha [Rickettsiales bacterium]
MSTERIENTFKKLKERKRAAIIPFIMGYDPDAKTSARILAALPEAGADIIEIGMAFSDPMADGKTIEEAGIRALKAGASVSSIIDMVSEFRANNNTTPIILMGYFNPIYKYGTEKFCKDAVGAGVDGVIIVDLPPEEEAEIRPYLDSTGLHLIRLIAPTSGNDRIKTLSASAGGFIYYISITGITGTSSANSKELKTRIENLKAHIKLPVAVGFGIKTAEQVKEVADFSDAVVVGSALVDKINKASDEDKVNVAVNFIKDLSFGLGK